MPDSHCSVQCSCTRKSSSRSVCLFRSIPLACRLVYNYCTTPRPDPIPEGVQGAFLVGEELYRKVEDSLRVQVSRIAAGLSSRPDDVLLAEYLERWNKFNTSVKVINHIFNYLNRFWVIRKRDEGCDKIYEIRILALVLWQDQLFVPLRTRIRACVLQAFHMDRLGEPINRAVLRGVIQSVVSLGVNNIGLYRTEIEIPVLDATEAYYRQVRDPSSILYIILALTTPPL